MYNNPSNHYVYRHNIVIESTIHVFVYTFLNNLLFCVNVEYEQY